MRHKLPEKAVSINSLANRTVTVQECIEAFYNGFQEALDIELVPYELTAEQQQFVEQLAETKYRSTEWNDKY